MSPESRGAQAPVVGRRAPDFSAPATGGRIVKLSALRGQNLVLYFYPRDNTPGCTREGQEFRDQYPAFQACNALVFGVSRDGMKAHERFRERQGFPFDLLSDEDEELCQLFAVLRDKNMYGRMVRGIERSTFLIDARGILRKEWRKVKPAGHAAEVLDALRELQSA